MTDYVQESPESKSELPSPAAIFSPTRRYSRAVRAAAPSAVAPPREPSAARKSCVVEFRSGEAVIRHPELKPYLDDGWDVENAVPRLSNVGSVELLVVLSRSRGEDLMPAADDDDV